MAIRLHNLSFSYPETPDKPVLQIPSWQVAAQEQVLLHGPSGGGKSTLLHLLSGLLAPSTGEVTIFDQRLDSMSQQQRDRFRAEHIGYVFQQFNLIPYLTALENIQLATQFSAVRHKADPMALLHQLNIAPQVYQQPVSQLSIGQQQRVAIARALINQPQLLIADEPTSSLDQHNRDNFMSLLMPLVAEHQITLILVSHDMTLSRYFQRIEALSEINQGITGDQGCS